MTLGGWITLFVSVGFAASLLVFCLHRILSGNGRRYRERSNQPPHDKD